MSEPVSEELLGLQGTDCELDEGKNCQPAPSYRSLCERSPAGIYAIRDGQITFANPALGKLLGQDPDSLVGKSLQSFIHPEDWALVREQLISDANQTFRQERLVARVIGLSGAVSYVEVLQSPLGGSQAREATGAMFDITARQASVTTTEDQLKFERLLADLSAGFVNLDGEMIDQQIDWSLKKLVGVLENDRSTLVELGADNDHVQVTHTYTLPDYDPFPLGPFSDSVIPWYVGKIRKGEAVFLRDIPAELPDEAVKELEHCAKQGIKSNVMIPLKAGGVLLGGLTFAFLRKKCEWPDEILIRLQLIGEVFANALLRRQTARSLRSTLAENESLRVQLEKDNLYLREQIVLKHHHGNIVGRSDAMTRVLADAERVAPLDTPVLLMGETGTGKELLAQTIHELSGRHRRPMVVVNCASLPATLIESELFGRSAGAYTGAASAQVGRFEMADGSTLFLDEIGELPLELQAKLLRVLQDGRFERLGCSTTVEVDVRIIAATNRDVEQACRDGDFRTDLYHRLNVFPIRVPSLRERRDDIPSLVWAFVESLGRRMGKSIKQIPRKSLEQLQQYDWPGNVRELSNTIERALILTDGETLHVEAPIRGRSRTTANRTLKENEREQILQVLLETGWRIRGSGGAAERLDIKPTTLEARMAKLGIKRPNKFSSQRGSPVQDSR